MRYKTRKFNNGEVVELIASGKLNNSDLLHLLWVASMELKKVGYRNLVFDLRSSSLEDDFSMLDLYLQVDILKEAIMIDELQMAVLYRQEGAKSEYMEQVANSEGVPLHYFKDRNQAMEWLTGI